MTSDDRAFLIDHGDEFRGMMLLDHWVDIVKRGCDDCRLIIAARLGDWLLSTGEWDVCKNRGGNWEWITPARDGWHCIPRADMMDAAIAAARFELKRRKERDA